MTSHASASCSSENSAVQPACPVCGRSEMEVRGSVRDRLFGLGKGEFNLIRCKSCGCIFQHPFPGMSALTSFYPEQYWWSEEAVKNSRCARLFRSLEKRYREFVTRDHVRFLDDCAHKNPGSGKLLLDIGCGNGTFLHMARTHGFVPHGMDVSSKAVEIAQSQYGFPVRQGAVGSGAWNGSRFDIVTMFHVLEHLTDPRLALSYARNLLEPSGFLIVQVPNVDSIQARIFGNRWYGLDVPRHVINFTPKALEILFREAGFDFVLTSRFSLRDNPASIASSLALFLDPIHRKGMGLDTHPFVSGFMEVAYLGLFLLSIPPAYLESVWGAGGTLWACAWIP